MSRTPRTLLEKGGKFMSRIPRTLLEKGGKFMSRTPRTLLEKWGKFMSRTPRTLLEKGGKFMSRIPRTLQEKGGKFMSRIPRTLLEKWDKLMSRTPKTLLEKGGKFMRNVLFLIPTQVHTSIGYNNIGYIHLSMSIFEIWWRANAKNIQWGWGGCFSVNDIVIGNTACEMTSYHFEAVQIDMNPVLWRRYIIF